MQCAVVLLAGIAAFALLLPLLSPLLPSRESDSGTTATWGVILAPCSVVILLVILYGELTSCPRCRKWWVRRRGEWEFVDREVFDKNGVPFAKSLYRTNYQCDACRHRWSVMQAEEYRAPTPTRRREKQHG
jgi:hypothetical protein